MKTGKCEKRAFRHFHFLWLLLPSPLASGNSEWLKKAEERKRKKEIFIRLFFPNNFEVWKSKIQDPEKRANPHLTKSEPNPTKKIPA